MSDIYLSLTETPSVVTLSQPVISGALSSTVTVANTVTVALDANSLSALENVTVTVGAAVSVSNFPASQVVTGSVAVTTMPAISISSVTISNFPASQTVAGTVTANVSLLAQGQNNLGTVAHEISGADINAIRTVIYSAAVNTFGDDAGAPVDSSNPLPVLGTVTVSNHQQLADTLIDETSYYAPLQVSIAGAGANIPISGTVTVGASSVTFNSFVGQRGDGSWSAISLQTGSNYVNANIPGSVTVGAMPSGALTTRFGSVTTANLATLTSCVTNTSRKFLLVQNIATSTVTIGIGFAPTTTQGIQLTAGAGLTFDAFCPTGGVWWLSSNAGSNFSILEG
jgi:hypothetical protein